MKSSGAAEPPHPHSSNTASGSTQGKSHLGGGQGAPVNRRRLIWEQHAGRMTSAREGAVLWLPVEQSPEGLHGHISPTQGQKAEKPQQELAQPAGHKPEPHCSDQSFSPAWAGLSRGFGLVLPFLNPTAGSLGAHGVALREQLSLLLALSPRSATATSSWWGQPQTPSLLHGIPSPEGTWLPNPCLEPPQCSRGVTAEPGDVCRGSAQAPSRMGL